MSPAPRCSPGAGETDISSAIDKEQYLANMAEAAAAGKAEDMLQVRDRKIEKQACRSARGSAICSLVVYLYCRQSWKI